MNERIRELIKQAGFEENDGHISIQGVYMFNTTRMENLAELIVKECASICELNGQSYKHSFTPAKAKLAESTSVYCGTLIKKHFGVEQ